MLSAMTTVFGSAIALQPRREVRRLTDDRLLLSRTRSDQIADHHQPGGDADAGLQRSAGLQTCPPLRSTSSPARTARSASSSWACG